MPIESHDVLDHLGVPVMVASADDSAVLYLNLAAKDLLGVAEEAAREICLREVFLEPEPYDECLRSLARSPANTRSDALVRRFDGTVLPVTISVGASFQSGRPTVVVSFHDLSALRRSERRQRLRAELEELLSDISIRFLSVADEELESSLREVLREVAQVALCESAFLVLWSDDEPRTLESWQRNPGAPTAWSAWLETDPEVLRRRVENAEGSRIVNDRTAKPPAGSPGTFSLLLIPLRGDRRDLGLLGLETSSADRSWDRVRRTLETVGRIFSNVFQRREAEARARRNEELLSGISRNVSDAVYRAEVDGDVVYLNPAFARMFGYDSVTELLAVPGIEIYHDPNVPGRLRDELLDRGAIRNREVCFRRADGTTFWGLLSIVVVEDATGHPRYFDGAITDIDERKRVEQALVAERELLAVTLAAIGDGVLAVDEDGRIALANERAGLLTGRSEHRMLGEPIDRVLVLRQPGDDGGPLRLAPLLDRGARIRHREAALEVTGSDETILVEWSISPWRRDEGRTSGSVIVISDLTERRRTEAERLKTNKLEAVGLLAGGIAHDFRNILSVIQGNASLVHRVLDKPDVVSELVEEILTASGRAGDLTEQLLTFSRGGAPVKARVDTVELIEEAIALSRRGSRAAYDVELASDLPPVEADAGQIHQVLNNLLINAGQAMSGGGTIHVRAGRAGAEDVSAVGLQGRFVEIEVRDEGPGIPDEDLPRIFDPYFTTKAGGTGLGLASAYSIVKRHGGRLSVASPHGSGASFSVFLPLAAPRPDDVSPETPKETEPGSASVARILVVDDEAPLRRSADRMLRILGYRPSTVDEGETAITAYRRALEEGDPYAVVLMDLTIPGGIGGKEAVTRLKRLDPTVRVVVSSGYSHDPVMAEFREHGFVDVLPKPYTAEQLAEVLSRVIDETG